MSSRVFLSGLVLASPARSNSPSDESFSLQENDDVWLSGTRCVVVSLNEDGTLDVRTTPGGRLIEEVTVDSITTKNPNPGSLPSNLTRKRQRGDDGPSISSSHIEVFRVVPSYSLAIRRRPEIEKQQNTYSDGHGNDLSAEAGSLVSGTRVHGADRDFLKVENWTTKVVTGFLPFVISDGGRAFEYVPVDRSICCYKVLSSVALRFRPDIDSRIEPQVVYEVGRLLCGTLRVTGPLNVVYVFISDVDGFEGWLPVQVGEEIKLEEVHVPGDGNRGSGVRQEAAASGMRALSSRDSSPFNLPAVQALAKRYDYKEFVVVSAARVAIFRRGLDQVNVFYTTRTVGTFVNHPRQGKTQLFRRNVSMDLLEDIFDNPRVHTGTGYHRVSQMPPPPPTSSSSSSSSSPMVGDDARALEELERSCARSAADHARLLAKIVAAKAAAAAAVLREKEEARKRAEARARDAALEQLRREEERRRLEEQERQRVETERRRLEAERQRREAEQRAAEKSRIAKSRGDDYDFSLMYHDTFHSMERVKLVAISYGGFLQLLDDGTYCAYHGIHRSVSDAVDKQHFVNCACSYMACGPSGQYLILKANGKIVWNINSRDLKEDINSSSSRPDLVAFGPDEHMYYVKFQDGSSSWGGDIDDRLSHIFRTTRVRDVHLGSRGAYFVRYEIDGVEKISCKNLPKEVMAKCSNGRIAVKQVLIDEDTATWFVRYSNK